MAGEPAIEDRQGNSQLERERRIRKQSDAIRTSFDHTDRTHCNNPETNILTVCLSAFSNEFPAAFRGKKFECKLFQEAFINFIKTWLNGRGDAKLKCQITDEELQPREELLLELEHEGLLSVKHLNLCLEHYRAKHKKCECTAGRAPARQGRAHCQCSP